MSKHQYLQKILFGEIVFDDDFGKIKKIQDAVKDNYDFNNGKIYKIYKDIDDVIYIGSTCFSLKNVCLNLKKNQNEDVTGDMIIFYHVFHLNNVNIE